MQKTNVKANITDKAVARATNPPLTICVIGSARSVHVHNRARCFAEIGHRVYLIAETPVSVDGVETVVAKSGYIPKLRVFSLFWNYVRILHALKPDIVHVHFAHSLGAWAAAFADRHPLVVSLMGGDILFEEQGRTTPSSRWLTLKLLECADLLTAKSNYLIGEVDRLTGLGHRAIRTIWGVDLKHFRRKNAHVLRESLKLPGNVMVLFSPKLLQPFYNLHLVIKALPAILAVHPQIRLIVSEYEADSAYRTYLIELARTLEVLDHVIFCGEISQSDMPLYYNMADIVISVPPSDGLPQTLFEAMACGTPNVIARLARYEEVVTHRQTAYFVDLTPDAIASGIIELASDAALRKHIVRNALRRVRQIANMDRDVRHIEEQYYSLQGRHKARLEWLDRMKIAIRVFQYVLIDMTWLTIREMRTMRRFHS